MARADGDLDESGGFEPFDGEDDGLTVAESALGGDGFDADLAQAITGMFNEGGVDGDAGGADAGRVDVVDDVIQPVEGAAAVVADFDGVGWVVHGRFTVGRCGWWRVGFGRGRR